MESTSLLVLADELLQAARQAHSGRAAHTVHGGPDHALRQAVLALSAGHDLAEHDSPGEATLQVLRGSIRLTTADVSWAGSAGDLVALPAVRHSLHAVEDSALVLTVVRGAH